MFWFHKAFVRIYVLDQAYTSTCLWICHFLIEDVCIQSCFLLFLHLYTTLYKSLRRYLLHCIRYPELVSTPLTRFLPVISDPKSENFAKPSHVCAAFPSLWTWPQSRVTTHQCFPLAECMNSAPSDNSIGACCSSQLRALSLTSNDRGLFVCAKDSGFISLMTQSSHHLWQKDGWQQD